MTLTPQPPARAASLPPGLAAYRSATWLAAPLVGWLLKDRARRGKEDPARLGERLGQASLPRPEGGLVWLHGASVGESLMLLPLVEAIGAARPDLVRLVTTQTVTSAALMARKLPKGVLHQFAPVDTVEATARALDHWRPSLLVMAESELWPNFILGAQARASRLALVNARMTERSLARWTRSPASVKRLLDAFAWMGAADRRTADGLSRLSGREVAAVGNLKEASPPLTFDAVEKARLAGLIGARPVWLAASTHEGEEATLLAAHKALRAGGEDWLLLLVPRHPERGAEVADLAAAAGFMPARRGPGEDITAETAVYVADTLGEMGLWFALCQAAFMAGSLAPGVGGHNPLEPARANAPIIAGPHVFNFEGLYAELAEAGALARAEGPAAIADAVREMSGPQGARAAAAAAKLAGRGAIVLQTVMQALSPLLPEAADARARVLEP